MSHIFELQRQRKTAYKNLSGGEKRRLLIAIALVGNPDLLILDEPSSNLDPHLRRQLWDVLNQYRQDGLTIVMTTHNMQEAQQYSDVVCVVKSGHIIASGSVPQLLEKYQLTVKVEVDAAVNPEVVAGCLGVTHVDVRTQGICVYGKNKGFEDEVIERLKKLGIYQFSVKTTDLEDVYLLTTGRRYMRYGEKNEKTDQSREFETLLLVGKELLQNAIDTSDVDQLYEAQERFERVCEDGSHEMLGLYYLGLCEYRLATLFAVDPSEKLQCVNQAISYLKKAIDLEDNFADAHALLAGAYGQKIGLKHHLGIVLGPKAKENREKAKHLEGDNPRVALIAGLHYYYTPTMFGGDKQRAMHNFELAVELFTKEEISNPIQPSWGYDEAYTWLGILHMEQQNIENARKAFIKALEVNPNNGWVKSYLLPGLNN